MPAVGKLEAFDASTTEFAEYQERVLLYFLANDVAEVKRPAVFLTSCGTTTYSLLRSLLAPTKPGEATLTAIFAALNGHFKPRVSEVVASFKFFSRRRQEGESVNDYVAALNKLVDDCNFTTMRDRMMRDQIVSGINDTGMQTRLLESENLNLESAKQLIIAMEAARKDAHALCPQAASAGAVETTNFVEPPRRNAGNAVERGCDRCGDKHQTSRCRHRTSTCFKCGRQGHIARACRAAPTGPKNRRDSRSVHQMDDLQEAQADVDECTMWSLRTTGPRPMQIEAIVNDVPLVMELDTGASVSIIGEHKFNTLFPGTPLEHSDVRLKSYSGELSSVLGKITAAAKVGTRESTLPLFVAKGTCPTLLGRDWMEAFKITITKPEGVNAVKSVTSLVEQFSEVFSETLGTLQGVSAKIILKEGSKPKFFKARPVPFALRDRVVEELQRMQREGIIRPVKTSQWAAPVVPVVKQDGRVRLCGDFKITINPATVSENYPIPRIEELFAKLSEGAKFTKLDLKDAYQQVQLDAQSQELVTINTLKGLFQFTRLPFGVVSAPALFQREMDNLLGDLPQVAVYFDDILVTGANDEDHWKNVCQVLGRLQEAGLRLKLAKCEFMKERVEYLGHIITRRGLHPSPKNVEAVLLAPKPQDVKSLQSYLGLINFYRKFIPRLSAVLHPLNRLLVPDVPWTWTSDEEEAFSQSKSLLASADTLAHFDPKKSTVLVTDASPYGLGAVLAQREASGEERPIAFASRSLIPAERNYSQLDKEALAMVFGVTRFKQYLWGRSFEAATDHKPLLGLLAADKPIPESCSPRILRWALFLSGYDYTLKYRPGGQIPHADGLSRLPLPTSEFRVECPPEVFMLQGCYPRVLSAHAVAAATSRDPCLSQLRASLWTGQGLPCGQPWKPYEARFDEMSVQSDCILLGSRVVVPTSLQAEVIQLLHESHPGVSKMKAVARSHVWWPALDGDITAAVEACHTCQEHQRAPRAAPVRPWPFPERPWSRLHVDFAGPLRNTYLFIAVDAYSKWIEVFPVTSCSTSVTVDCLRKMFAIQGLPDIVVSDNGPAFVSEEFKTFLRKNGIRQVLVPPYHPASNGAAERAVQTIKQKLKKAGSGDLHTQIARLLLSYRTTPHEVTGCSPAELLMGRKLKTALGLLRPDLRTTVNLKQLQQDVRKNGPSTRIMEIEPGMPVFARNFRPGPRWVPATVESDQGFASRLQLPDGRVWTRHHDHIRIAPRTPSPTGSAGLTLAACPSTSHVDQPLGSTNAADTTALKTVIPPDMGTTSTAESGDDIHQAAQPSATTGLTVNPEPVVHQQTPVRRSTRARKPVVRFSP